MILSPPSPAATSPKHIYPSAPPHLLHPPLALRLSHEGAQPALGWSCVVVGQSLRRRGYGGEGGRVRIVVGLCVCVMWGGGARIGCVRHQRRAL